uniref:ATPase AAA-type core domain-containing protein n=1 Tax=Craspedostauros australis TaxID=1486917 RepID=A0A7R9ZQX8_9STRA
MDASYDADSVNRHSSHDENDSCNSGDGYDDDGYDDGSTINRDDDNQHGLTDYTWDKDSKKSLWRHFLESTDEDSKAVVKLLVQRSERLLKEAKGCTILADLVDHAMSAPGMQGGSQSSSKTSRHKTSTSINDLGAYMEHRQTLHSYISEQARSICNLLDLGVPINDAFVDRLLAVPKEDEEKNHPASSSPPDGEDNAVAMSAPAKNDSSPKGLPSVDKTKPVHAQSGPPASPTAFAGGLSNDKTDALSLAGILNVLDGVVDTPSRLLIMTTNHPEMLDDALIRPGRIDKNIRMGYMASQEVAEMLEHYFQTTLDGAQRCRIRCLVGEDGAGSDDGGTRQANMASSRRLTPAQVEQMVVEYESVDDVIGRLESLP